MSGKEKHILVVELDEKYAARFPDADPSTLWRLECVNPVFCTGWIECRKDHDGYDPDEETSPAFDQYEDVLIHGEFHEWQYGYSWCVPLPDNECSLRGYDLEPPAELWDREAENWKIGRWRVEAEIDDDCCTLLLVSDE